MENIVYNELLVRGYNVDVGIVDVFAKNSEGKRVHNLFFPYCHSMFREQHSENSINFSMRSIEIFSCVIHNLLPNMRADTTSIRL